MFHCAQHAKLFDTSWHELGHGLILLRALHRDVELLTWWRATPTEVEQELSTSIWTLAVLDKQARCVTSAVSKRSSNVESYTFRRNAIVCHVGNEHMNWSSLMVLGLYRLTSQHDIWIPWLKSGLVPLHEHGPPDIGVFLLYAQEPVHLKWPERFATSGLDLLCVEVLNWLVWGVDNQQA